MRDKSQISKLQSSQRCLEALNDMSYIYVIYQGCCLIWGPKHIISMRNCFVLHWLLTYWVSRISFGSLATCRSLCENSSYICIELLMSKYRMLESIQLEFVDTIRDVSVVYIKSDIVCILATQFSVWSQVFNHITPLYNHMDKQTFYTLLRPPMGSA